MLSSLLTEFAMAWSYFVKIPLPSFLRGNGTSYPELDGHSALLRPMMPVVGMALGLMLAVPLRALRFLPGGKLTAGLAGLVIAPLVLELITSWNGLNSLAAYFDFRRQGATRQEALTAEPIPMNEPRTASSSIFLLSIYLVRMLMFGTLAYFAPYWIIVALTGSWLVRAELVTLPLAGTSGIPAIRAPQDWTKRHWYFAIVIMILAGIIHPLNALLGFCVAWFSAWLASRWTQELLGGLNRHAYALFSYAAELILLFLGVLMYAGTR